MTQTRACRLAFALDYPNLAEAQKGAAQVSEYVDVLKVGLELFVQAGPPAVAMARDSGCEVFLDLKLHDIEKTVERAVGTASALGANYLTIHTCGGPGMMESAAKRAQSEGAGLKVLGVTVLTSLSPEDLLRVGVPHSPTNQVRRLALLAKESGLAGLVCSSLEVADLRTTVGDDLLLVTPGIRPPGHAVGDQKRVGTPEEAIASGSDMLVVGRPIRDAEDPKAAAQSLASLIQRCSA